jgi:hypothetical protein
LKGAVGNRPTTNAPRRPRRGWLAVLPLFAGVWACTARNPAFEGVPAAVAPDAGRRSARPRRSRPGSATRCRRVRRGPDARRGRAAPDAAPDLAADRGPPGATLLVVGETTLSKSDTQLKTSLTRLGFTVVARDGQEATAADATGKALVVISGSSWSDDVGGKFRDVPVPVVVFDDALFAPMKLTGTRSGTDFGDIDNQTRLLIIDDTHPLAGGLSGLVTVAGAGIMVSWGVPSSAAVLIATPRTSPAASPSSATSRAADGRHDRPAAASAPS